LSQKQKLSGLKLRCSSISWRGGSSDIHSKLQECVAFYLRYLYATQDNAKERGLNLVRPLVGNAGLDKANVLLLQGKTFWMGTKSLPDFKMSNSFGRDLDIREALVSTYFLTIILSKPKLHPIVSLCAEIPAKFSYSEEALKLKEYDEFILPPCLQSICHRLLGCSGTRKNR